MSPRFCNAEQIKLALYTVYVQLVTEVCDSEGERRNMSVDGVKSVSFNSFNIRENITQAIKPTAVELKLNTML